MTTSHVLLLALLLGVFNGLRALSPPAVTAWGGHLGWIALRSPFAWLGTLPAAIIFTVLAIGELVNDKLPKTPPRTAPPGLIARLVMGALVGGSVATAGGASLVTGLACGIVGALIGTFGGYFIRTRLVKALGAPDFIIALLEDAVTIAGSFWVVSRF
jgi:uncharacterized membrane protein